MPVPARPPQQPPGRAQRSPAELEPIIAFYVFAAANVAAAFFAPIQDCDEVFNYWEPTHYLDHGYGLQTWEYSPEYAIRSWTYTGLHALVIKLGLLPLRSFGFAKTKVAEFYFLRTFLALVCAVCQTRLYSVIARTFNPRVALFFIFVLVFSPGMYHAAPAYLPSSFAMYMTMLGFSAFMDWKGGIRTAQGIMWFGIGAVLGWPFAAALVLPFVVEEIILASLTDDITESVRRLVDGCMRSFLFLVNHALALFKIRFNLCIPRLRKQVLKLSSTVALPLYH
jgi:alpha-1,2-mannosyltransferase